MDANRIAKPDALPLAHRLAIGYLALPLAIWFLSWLEWWVGIPATVALALALGTALRGPWRTPKAPWVGAVLLVALVWVLSTPSGGVFRAIEGDWVIQRSVLLDLSRGAWPTHLVDHLHDEPLLLRYYLGYYLVPTLFAQWFGQAAMNWAVPLWTWGGVGLVCLLFVRGLATGRAVAVALFVLVFFSGLDAIEYVARRVFFGAGHESARDLLGDGMSFVRAEASPMFLEFQSHAQTFGHTPQHFIPGGLGTLLMVQLRRHPRFLAVSGLVLTLCLFWSSLLFFGLLILAGALLVGNEVRRFATWQNLVVAPALATVLALYLTAGTVAFPSGWLWEIYASGFQLAADVAFLYASEVLIVAVLVWRARPTIVRDPFFIVAVALLLAAPWWWFGASGFSQLTLRITVPPLFVLCYHAARVLARRFQSADVNHGGAAALGLAGVLCVGAVSSAAFYLFNLLEPRWVPYQRTGYALFVDPSFWDIEQKSVPVVPAALGAILRDTAELPAKGDLLFRSKVRPLHEVYRMESRLLYVNRQCRRRDTRFLLRVYPATSALGALGQSATFPVPYDVLDFNHNWHHKGHGRCFFRQRLPAYAIGRIVTGELSSEGIARWMAEFRFQDGKPVATNVLLDVAGERFIAQFPTLTATPPTARSLWDVRVGDDAIVYTKTPCAWEDTKTRFFLHVTGNNPLSSPDRRRVSNLDFDFDERGVLFDETCLVERELPHAWERIRTGQFVEDPASGSPSVHTWEVDIRAEAEQASAPRGAPHGVESAR